MRNYKIQQIGVMAFTVFAFASAGATTNYVDCSLSGYAGHDGTSWGKAFKTIQEGVDKCQEGDTVLVAPGIYSDGGKAAADEKGLNRVLISTRGITVRSSGGKAVTVIKGLHDPKSVDGHGNGPNAVRCVYISADDCLVEGFTLADGAAHPNAAEENSAASNGGGLRSYSSATTSCIADCAVTNCSGVRGGAIYNGRVVRTLLVGNTASVKASVGYVSSFLNCVITRNNVRKNGVKCDSNSLFASGRLVNCSVFRNPVARLAGEGSEFYNTIAVLNMATGSSDNTLKAYGCVFSEQDAEKHFAEIVESTIGAPVVQFENPFFDDVRLLPTSVAIGRGDSKWREESYFALPERVSRYVDYVGDEIPMVGSVSAGALQNPGPTPAGGMLQFDKSTVSVDGCDAMVENEYVSASDAYPTQYLVKAWVDSGRFYGFRRYGMGYSGSGLFVFPRPDDTIYMMPPRTGLCYTNNLVTAQASKVFFVNPVTGSDSDATGQGLSEAKPYKTIQKAVDKAASSYSVINCAAGDYNSEDGLQMCHGLTNRITIGSNQGVRIIGAGVGKTILWGKKSPAAGGDDAAHYYGGGAGAIRCLCSDAGGGAAIQALTLKGGRCTYTGTDVEVDQQDRGAGALIVGGMQILDCEFDDCVGNRGFCYGGTIMRTKFTNCYGYRGGLRYVTVNMCVFINNIPVDSNGLIGNGSDCRHVTAVGVNDRAVTGVPFRNSIVTRVDSTSSSWGSDWSGSYVGDCPSCGKGVQVAPLLADVAGGCLKVLSSSRAFTDGGSDWGDYALAYSPDINGDPVRFVVSDRALPGAIQSVAQGLTILGNGKNGVILTTQSQGYIRPGETATVTYDESAVTRPVSGFMVNDELSEVPASMQWSFTAPDEGVPVVRAFTLEPVFSTNWYVNANCVDDSGNGFRPETAKKTFHGERGIFSIGNVRSGDCVHAAAGVYGQGHGYKTEDMNCRVSVPSGVSVVADCKPEDAFIVGAPATIDESEGEGIGQDAVRGVFLANGSVIRNFTITGGRTTNNDSGNSGYGGGVFCAANPEAYVENCIISNNVARRGGGMHRGSASNTKFFENRALANRSACSENYMKGCVIDHNRGVNATQSTIGLLQCTFGADNTDLSGNVTSALWAPSGEMVNNIFLTTVRLNNSGAKPNCFFTNCLFVAGGVSYGDWGEFVSCLTTNLTDIAFDDNYEPIIGCNPAVDAGYQHGSFADVVGKRDCNGNQRIYNRRIDIGAVEADWRAEYGRVLGAGVSVKAASEDVVAENGKLTLGDGAILSGEWNALQEGRRAKYEYSVSAENGTLVGVMGDTDVSVADAMRVYRFRSTDSKTAFDFAYSGDGCGTLSSFNQVVPGVAIIVR